MRLSICHVDSFWAEPTERGRSKVADSDPRTVAVEDALVVFAAAEKQLTVNNRRVVALPHGAQDDLTPSTVMESQARHLCSVNPHHANVLWLPRRRLPRAGVPGVRDLGAEIPGATLFW